MAAGENPTMKMKDLYIHVTRNLYANGVYCMPEAAEMIARQVCRIVMRMCPGGTDYMEFYQINKRMIFNSMLVSIDALHVSLTGRTL